MYRGLWIIGLYGMVAVVGVLGGPRGGTCAGVVQRTVSPDGEHDARRNLLLGVGIFEANTAPGFLFLHLQPTRASKKSGQNNPDLV